MPPDRIINHSYHKKALGRNRNAACKFLKALNGIDIQPCHICNKPKDRQDISKNLHLP